ncbi:MAG: hypothetical protein PHH08_03920 [Candidatus ainarchaeum sp.]|nr:hypothetical protein [Candidatus ainarchaeum sp.]
MGVLGSIIGGIKKAIPVLAAKVASILLFFIIIGLFIGFWLARQGYNIWVLALPIVALFVMWQKLDEGFLVLVLAAVLVFLAPEFFMG